MREHVLAVGLVVLGVTLRSYATVASTVALVLSFYALFIARQGLNEARRAMQVAKGEVPPHET